MDKKETNKKSYLFNARVKLTKLEIKVASLPDIPEKHILQRELDKAKNSLDEGETEYTDVLWNDVRRTISKIKLLYSIIPHSTSSNIQLLLRGIFIYSLLVFFFGICAVIVHVYNDYPTPWPVELVKWLGLDPIFKTVMALSIKPEAYYWGLLGGAGAVVSLVKRFDNISKHEGRPWLFFSRGLFNPIVGSLSAVVACRFASQGLLDEYKGVPLLVVAFFAGFSERLISKIGGKT